MHRIVDNGVEKKVSFDSWQKHTNIHYEDDNKKLDNSLKGSKPEATSRKATKYQPVRPRNRKGSNSNKLTNSSAGVKHPSVAVSSRRKSSAGSRKSFRDNNIDPKHFVIGSSPKRDVIGGSHYSRALLVNAHPLTKGPAPDNLQYLQNVDHLFFKLCKKFPPEIKDFNPREKRGIWNLGGRCVYYVGMTNYYWFKNFRCGFTYEVVDYVGRPVLTSTGSQWTFGFKGKVSVKLGNGYLLGTMEQDICSSLYNIKDSQGRIVYTIQSPCYGPAIPFVVWCFKEEFEICMDDTISEIGRITKSWGDEFPEFDGDLGLEFETSDDNRVKALLLGVYFLVEFQYYKYGGNGVVYFIVMLIFIIGLSFVLSNGFGFFPQINSPLIPGESIET